LRNAIRSLTLGLSRSHLAPNPGKGKLNVYYRYVARYSAAFAFLSDVTLMLLGGALKRKESLSGRFADAITHMYMATSTLKHYQDQGENEEDLPLVEWCCQYSIYHVQMALDGIIRNFPIPFIGVLLRGIIFPLGRRHRLPSDALGRKVAEISTMPGDVRDRLTHGAYINDDPNDVTGRLDDALNKATAVKHADWLKVLVKEESITKEEQKELNEAHNAVMAVIQVDDFKPGKAQIKYKK